MANNTAGKVQRGSDVPPPMQTMGSGDDMPGMGLIARGQTLSKVQTGYQQAISVIQPRKIAIVEKRLMEEARLAGESFYYSWGRGDDAIEGASIGLALAAARCFGNCAVEPQPVQETEEAWYLPTAFIDIETGFTLVRNFRQSKSWTVHGRHDAQRKEDMRFQIGQSKSIRNVICNAIPKWIIDRAIEMAKSGVRERIEQYIKDNSLAAAQDQVIYSLGKKGVEEHAILAKFAIADRKALAVEHLIALRGDLYALESGADRVEELFPAMGADPKASDKKTENKAAAKQLDQDMEELMKRGETAEAGKSETTEATANVQQAEKLTGKQLEEEFSASLAGAKTVQEITSMARAFDDIAVTDEDHAMIAGMSEEAAERLPKPTEQPKKNGGGLPGMDASDEPNGPKGGQKKK